MTSLLVRRHRSTRTVSYYRCFALGPVTLARLVSLVCLRWRVEMCQPHCTHRCQSSGGGAAGAFCQ